jgi:hypothetical protein
LGFRVLSAFFLVLVHLVSILLFGLPATILLIWAQLEVTQMSIIGKYFTIMDFLFTSSYEPWWDFIDYPEILYVVCAIFVVYFFFALIELVSFYLTSYHDNGRYKIELTTSKKIVQYTFWSFIGLYIGIYFAYITIVLVWFLLGAVLNPNKYLAFASASATLIMFIKTKYDYITNLFETIQQKVKEIVNTQISELIKATCKMMKEVDPTSAMDNVMSGDLQKKSQVFLAKSIASVLEKSGISVTGEQIEAISEGKYCLI